MTAGADITSHISIALPHSLVILCEEHNGFDMQSLISNYAEHLHTVYLLSHHSSLFGVIACISLCVIHHKQPLFGSKLQRL
jgi:hypothetical protein